MNRRAFLSSGLAALGGARLPLLARYNLLGLEDSRADSQRTLVVIEMRGGNDGLNTLVPYGDDEYYRARKTLRQKPGELHKLDEYRGLNPNLAGMARHFADGTGAIFQGVGYPNPSLSHFMSREIWDTADLRGRAGNIGWLGRLCDQAFATSNLPELSVHIGKEPPYSLHSPIHTPLVFSTPDTYRWLGDERGEEALEPGEEKDKRSTLDRIRNVMAQARTSSTRILAAVKKYETDVEYPRYASAGGMRTAAALIGANLGSRVISLTFGGFDTHAGQKFSHANALEKLDRALDAFLNDLKRSEGGRNTLVLVISEFGRRVRENASAGTDHGKAGVAFAFGEPVRGGLYGEYPSLRALDDKDLRYNLDFRSIYASAIAWMGGDPELVLGERFEAIPFV